MQTSLTGNAKERATPKLVPVVLALVVGAGAIAGTMFWQSRQGSKVTGTTETVRAKSLTVKIKASGTVTPYQTVNLSPKVAGKLVELPIEQGDLVRKGQTIARMDDSGLQPQLLQAQASLAVAQANLTKLQNGARAEDIAAAKARVEAAGGRAQLSQTRLGRYQNLADQGVITRDRLQELATDAQSTQATLREQQKQLEQLTNGTRAEDITLAQAQMAEATARLKNIEVQLEDTNVRAPFDGIITQKYTNVGAFVTPTTSASGTSSATSASIVAIANGLEILAKVPEVDISQIQVGQPVEIVADAYPDKVFSGKVRLIAPEAVVEQNVTSFQVRVTLDAAKPITGEQALKSGMNVDLLFIGQRLDNALVVPAVAIVTREGQTGVLVPDRNNLEKFIPVTIGTTLGNETQILKGLQAGQRVFVSRPDVPKGLPK